MAHYVTGHSSRPYVWELNAKVNIVRIIANFIDNAIYTAHCFLFEIKLKKSG